MKGWGTVHRKIRLADGRIKDSKIYGQYGGDVFDIRIKHHGKWVHPSKIKGRKYPLKVLRDTPFIDMSVYKKKR